MAATVASPNHGRDVFLSVFPKPIFTTPTPEATPNIGSAASPETSFGGFNMPTDSEDSTVKSNRAWSAVTRYLMLASESGIDRGNLDQETADAFRLALELDRKKLTKWYGNEIKVHFDTFVLPYLQVWKQPVQFQYAHQNVQTTLQTLLAAQQHYLERINILCSTATSSTLRVLAKLFLSEVRDDYHSRLLNSLSQDNIQRTLSHIMYRQLRHSLEQGSNVDWCLQHNTCDCSLNMKGVPLRELHEVGFGKTIGQRAFSSAVQGLLQGPAIARRCFQVDWIGQKSVVPKLRSWIKNHLYPVIERSLAELAGDKSLKIPPEDVELLISGPVAKLGGMRTDFLFDYVKRWPASAGAVQDIWEYLTAGNQADKANVCNSFSVQIKQRLLHAGASTAEVLGIYVNVIHVFMALDSRGVLLEKVAIPIRSYLHGRDDTVSIIAASFLADVNEEGNVVADVDKMCPDITAEVTKSTQNDRRDKKSLNWDDMEWTPDPIDAGPDYKSSRSDDVVTSILDLFDQEKFIEELKTVLAQHLLDTRDFAYAKEIRLVELLKSRLETSKGQLQAVEVMLEDMKYSVKLGKRINQYANYESSQPPPTPKEIQDAIPEAGITISSLYSMFETRMKQPQFLAAVRLVANKQDDLFFAKRTRLPADARGTPNGGMKGSSVTNFGTQIFSRAFWPQLESKDFKLPESIHWQSRQFVNSFERLGTQQKLQFQPALAKVSVRLELEDRLIEESDLPGWRASVIDMFASERIPSGLASKYDNAVGVTPEQLMEALDMEEDLVQDALNFWIGKSVLYRQVSGAYSVLERLDMPIEAAQQPEPQLPDQDDLVSAVKSQDAMLRESAPMFSTFIANMLRNQGPKEVGGMMGITSLLKMVLPSFMYGEDEVRWLLGEMRGRGEVVKEGEVWRVAS